MKIELEYIEKLAKLLNNNGLSEISLEDDEQAITIRKDAADVVAVPATGAQVQTTVVEKASDEPAKVLPKGKAITSPMVGTFYSSPTPEAEPFVEVGSVVSQGDVVCIIEAMKLMNEIKSEHEGKITQICVKNGDPIEYGQVLMYME